MEDLVPRGKALFWGLFAAVSLLAAVPSLVLLDAARQYLRLLSGWDPGVLKASTTRRLPHDGRDPPDLERRIEFVGFRLKAPKAKKIFLAGDFNRWDPQALPLVRRDGGWWEIQLPLPPGRYRYLFQADGAWTLDPASSEKGLRDGLETSVRAVEPH